ncbi:DNA cytosine methyltransferase [Bradyrhizobium ottawaense]|uniref:DNA cytosine methyltransferase n=1 Tax=Bradyrhizobium ottawaense TaxID=931866 RepID=UPI001BA9EBCB|nr:DNA cytosine methyltransferase [Bradyrhizobium ottawaense]MBR1365038.1 DNA cytosine methyltransferase [Bradyrhizobium ottawaense]
MPRRTFIDLFAGCGGLSLGLFQAGWQGLFAIEKSSDAFATLSHNLCKPKSRFAFAWPDWLECKAQTTSQILRKHQADLTALRGKVDLIAGGPPCQGFSTAGLRNPNDPRNQLTNEYIRIVQIVQPKFLLLENVRGFQAAFKGAAEPYSARVVRRLSRAKVPYDVHTAMVKASDFGVPQPRPRFIMVGIRRDLNWTGAAPFQNLAQMLGVFRDTKGLGGGVTSSRQAIGDLELDRQDTGPSTDTEGFLQINYRRPGRLSNYQRLLRDGLDPNYQPNSLRLANHRAETASRFEHILKHCPRGKKVPQDYRDRHGMRKQCIAALHPDLPAHTVTTLPDDLLHYSEPRILTVRENARLQSFPDWFDFKGKYTTGGKARRHQCPRYTQVGNAVPPLMAEAIGSSLLVLAEKHEYQIR